MVKHENHTQATHKNKAGNKENEHKKYTSEHETKGQYYYIADNRSSKKKLRCLVRRV
jgi:hypothetical protein